MDKTGRGLGGGRASGGRGGAGIAWFTAVVESPRGAVARRSTLRARAWHPRPAAVRPRLQIPRIHALRVRCAELPAEPGRVQIMIAVRTLDNDWFGTAAGHNPKHNKNPAY